MFGVKPMNCPAHCRVFQALAPTRRELPLRLSEFSALHRNEASGALSGLTRVRRFHQDDGHVFCRDPTEERAEWEAGGGGGAPFESQIQREVLACLRQVQTVYPRLGFDTRALRLRLATRPADGSVGTDAVWAEAEGALLQALRAVVPGLLGKEVGGTAAVGGGDGSVPLGEHPVDALFEVDEGGGAFYGPKIDVALTDALGREHQCATIQLDFNLPGRMGVDYPAFAGQGAQESGDSPGDGAPASAPTGLRLPPVLVHRAILGSVERMLAVLAEHHNGKWPFWLAPYQVAICGVAERHAPACRQLLRRLRAAGVRAHLDASSRTVGKRVRQALFEQAACVVAVVGDEELQQAGGDAPAGVSLRFRDAGVLDALGVRLLEEGAAGESKLEMAGASWSDLEAWCRGALEGRS